MPAFRRLRTTGGGARPVFPTNWYVSRYSGNPVIDVATNPNETHEQYEPFPFQMTNGDINVLCKGSYNIYRWKSTDGGATFALQNSNNPVIAVGGVGTWDHDAALEPAGYYDSAAGTVHVWYKGADNLFSSPNSTEWDVGYATAADSNLNSWTKYASNPILTAAAVSTHLTAELGTLTNVYDLGFSSILKIGATWHFYGFVLHGPDLANARYSVIQAVGSSVTSIDISGTIMVSQGPNASTIRAHPDVFKTNQGYGMLYQYGSKSSTPRSIRSMTSPDGTTWTPVEVDFMAPPGAGTWESDWVYVCKMLKENVAPFASPIYDGKRIRLYYSGVSDQGPPQPTGHHANIGLAYLSPP